MPSPDTDLVAVSHRHGLSEGAVRALAEALARSHGGGAQWNHPDLGGMGQWMGGGMLQIGSMFDTDLKRRVGAALDDLAASAGKRRDTQEDRPPAAQGARDWWPEGLGTPSATGAQNAMRYACFPAARRLVVDDNGRVTVYDTGAHRLTGFSQAQAASAQDLVFSGLDGPVHLKDLTAVE